MKFLLFIVVIALVVFLLVRYTNVEFSLEPSATCDAIVERQKAPKISEEEGGTSYNDYGDGLKFFFNLCSFR